MAFYRNRPRRATLAEWTSVNPTLMLGEMAIITPDTGTGTGKVKVKFGDGVSSFNSLPYAYNEEEIDIDALISDFTESSTETDAVSGDTYGVIIGKFVKSIKTFRTNISNIVGNIGTIANLLTTDKSSLVNAVNELKNGKIEKANIVNNTVTTVSGTVLDGRMGKILQDQITEQNNNLARFMHQTIYLNMVNGVGSITVDGLTNTSFALVQNAQGNNYYVVKTEVSTNTLTVYLNDYASGIMAFNAIIKK